MKRFLRSPYNRTIVLMLVGNVLAFVWLRPDFRRLAAERTHATPAWAIVLLILSASLFAYCALEIYLIHVLREPPPSDP